MFFPAVAVSGMNPAEIRKNHPDLLKPDGIICPDMRLAVSEKIIALTLDACSGEYDQKIIQILKKNNISATIFAAGKWIDRNKNIFSELAADKLFLIASHGLKHRPCFLEKTNVFGISGTDGIEELFEETAGNAEKIEKLTGIRPVFFRSGTGWYDKNALKIIELMGFIPAGWNTPANDYSEKLSADIIIKSLSLACPGSIIIAHLNHPSGNTAEALEVWIPSVIRQGYKFVKLGEYRIICTP